MRKFEDLAKTLPPREIPFEIKVEGNVTGIEYEGKFTVKVPLVQDMSRLGVELARLNNGVPHEDLDIGTATLNNAIAYLKVLLVEAPEWFYKQEQMNYGLNTLDSNVAIAIFDQAENKVSDWKKAIRGGKKGEKEGEKEGKSK